MVVGIDDYDGKMDRECIKLCDALNSVPGILTFNSCCGHGKHPYRIWFKAQETQSLMVPVLVCNRNYGGNVGWKIEADHVESNMAVVFLIKGPSGEGAYAGSEELADHIMAIISFQKKLSSVSL